MGGRSLERAARSTARLGPGAPKERGRAGRSDEAEVRRRATPRARPTSAPRRTARHVPAQPSQEADGEEHRGDGGTDRDHVVAGAAGHEDARPVGIVAALSTPTGASTVAAQPRRRRRATPRGAAASWTRA